MHELPISMDIMSIVLEHATEAGAARVKSINLTVGQLSGFVPECIELQMQILSKGTIAEGAGIAFNLPPASLHCRSCSKDYNPRDIDVICPDCGSLQFDVLSGRECLVESIEVE